MDYRTHTRADPRERSVNDSYQPTRVHFSGSNDNFNGATFNRTQMPYNNQSTIGASNKVAPDTRREEYMWHKKLEQASIAHQTYRTLPIVSPKPKTRHDLVTTVTYMNYSMDPTWNIRSGSRPPSRCAYKDEDFLRRLDRERKLNTAITGYNEDTARGLIPQGNNINHSCCCSNHCSAVRQDVGASNNNELADSLPAFDYRRYIDSTRGRVS